MVQESIAPVNKPASKESVNPAAPEVYTDEAGQRWRVNPDGGRLKIGGTIGPGAPKKEVREKWLAFANKPSLEWAQRVLSSSDIPDDAPVKLKAIELSLAYGLGKQDEVVKLQDEAFIGHATDVLASFNGRVIDLNLTREYLTKLHSVLGLKE